MPSAAQRRVNSQQAVWSGHQGVVVLKVKRMKMDAQYQQKVRAAGHCPLAWFHAALLGLIQVKAFAHRSLMAEGTCILRSNNKCNETATSSLEPNNKSKKGENMKTTNKSNRWLLGLACALAVGVAIPVQVRAADQVKGVQKLLELNKVKTVGDVEALKVGDTFAMACAKCETIMVKEVVSTAKGAEVLAANGKPTKLIGKHLCPGCGSTIEIVGHGKAKESKITHTCTACGDTSAFCCATKSGSATKGMVEEKK
jgi:hypothetical protein